MRLPDFANPQYRRDPVTGRTVIIAPSRAHRPNMTAATPVARESTEPCPFCLGNESLTPPEIWANRPSGAPDTPGWTIRVVPNRYPAVMNAREGTGSRRDQKDSLFEVTLAIGRHEIVIECPGHAWTASGESDEHWAAILSLYAERLTAMSHDPAIGYALVFKNAGPAAGASQEHAHSQILGLAETPPEIERELEGCRAYYERVGSRLHGDLIQKELASGERVIARTDRFVAWTPFASRFPLEACVAPLANESSEPRDRFDLHPREEFGELGQLVRRVTVALETMIERPAHNLIVHTGPLAGPRRPYYHWHMELVPRLVGLAGSEIGGGVFINPIPPEWAAARYREQLGR